MKGKDRAGQRPAQKAETEQGPGQKKTERGRACVGQGRARIVAGAGQKQGKACASQGWGTAMLGPDKAGVGQGRSRAKQE